jgi:hypothetical protein
MTQQPGNYTVSEYPLKYLGNIVWPILFLILFFPLGILLLILNTAVRVNGVFYSLHYRGSQPWLIFWTIVFFPVAIVLGALNGFDVIAQGEFPKISEKQ